MSNPYLDNSAVFGSKPQRDVARTEAQTYGQAQANPYAAAGYGAAAGAGVNAAAQDNLADATVGIGQDRLTYDHVLTKTAAVFGVLIVAGVVGWQISSPSSPVWAVGMVGGLVLGLVNAFKKSPSPALILAYAAFQGVFLGAISAAYNSWMDGIVLQAVLATVATFAATLILYRSGKVRVTPKFQRFLLIAMSGYLIFSLLNVILVWTGVLDGWGMRGGTWGILIGLFAVGLAAMSLIQDFDSIDKGVRNGVAAKYAWSAAFGLAVTLVWLYLEFLRLLAILRGDN